MYPTRAIEAARPTCCRPKSSRDTSRRPRPTPRTTNRCPPGCRRTSSGRAASSWPRCRTACSTTPGSATRRRSAATRCSRAVSRSRPPSTRTCRRSPTTRSQRAAAEPRRARLGLVARRDRSAHRRGQGDGQTSRLRRQPVQHRDPSGRAPTGLHVEGDHARRRAGQRLFARTTRINGSAPCSVPSKFAATRAPSTRRGRVAATRRCGQRPPAR